MNKNKVVLNSFVKYCRKHPEMRFWQALRNWAGFCFVAVSKSFFEDAVDSFYFKGKRK